MNEEKEYFAKLRLEAEASEIEYKKALKEYADKTKKEEAEEENLLRSGNARNKS